MKVVELPREYFLRRQIRARFYGNRKLPVPNDRPSFWSSDIGMRFALACGALAIGTALGSVFLWAIRK